MGTHCDYKPNGSKPDFSEDTLYLLERLLSVTKTSYRSVWKVVKPLFQAYGAYAANGAHTAYGAYGLAKFQTI